MTENKLYTTKLGAGLGLVAETRMLLEIWEPSMSPKDLNGVSLESGMFPNIAARRLTNIIKDCFAPRYLINGGQPAKNLKKLQPSLSSLELKQFLFLYTARANRVLADFVRKVYWPKYSAGYSEITNEDSRKFIETAADRGLTMNEWAESMIVRVSSYLTGCCADYGLLEPGRKTSRKILPFRISPKMIVYLAYDLHFSGFGDNSVLENEDWQLFGLNHEDVLAEMKKNSTKGDWIVQAAGGAVRIGWNYNNFEEVTDAIT